MKQEEVAAGISPPAQLAVRPIPPPRRAVAAAVTAAAAARRGRGCHPAVAGPSAISGTTEKAPKGSDILHIAAPAGEAGGVHSGPTVAVAEARWSELGDKLRLCLDIQMGGPPSTGTAVLEAVATVATADAAAGGAVVGGASVAVERLLRQQIAVLEQRLASSEAAAANAGANAGAAGLLWSKLMEREAQVVSLEQRLKEHEVALAEARAEAVTARAALMAALAANATEPAGSVDTGTACVSTLSSSMKIVEDVMPQEQANQKAPSGLFSQAPDALCMRRQQCAIEPARPPLPDPVEMVPFTSTPSASTEKARSEKEPMDDRGFGFGDLDLCDFVLNEGSVSVPSRSGSRPASARGGAPPSRPCPEDGCRRSLQLSRASGASPPVHLGFGVVHSRASDSCSRPSPRCHSSQVECEAAGVASGATKVAQPLECRGSRMSGAHGGLDRAPAGGRAESDPDAWGAFDEGDDGIACERTISGLVEQAGTILSPSDQRQRCATASAPASRIPVDGPTNDSEGSRSLAVGEVVTRPSARQRSVRRQRQRTAAEIRSIEAIARWRCSRINDPLMATIIASWRQEALQRIHPSLRGMMPSTIMEALKARREPAATSAPSSVRSKATSAPPSGRVLAPAEGSSEAMTGVSRPSSHERI